MLASGVVRNLGLVVFSVALLSCAGTRPQNLGVSGSSLAPCPTSPNCVSSDTDDEAHAIAPLALAVPPGEAWTTALSVLPGLPRTRLVTQSSDYLHAECRSRLLGFVDDLELHLRPEQGIIAVRSASRLGYGDMGVNRRRVEELRALLAARGVVHSAP